MSQHQPAMDRINALKAEIAALDLRWTPLFGQKGRNLSYGSWGAGTM